MLAKAAAGAGVQKGTKKLLMAHGEGFGLRSSKPELSKIASWVSDSGDI
jgi:hypothetical protein